MIDMAIWEVADSDYQSERQLAVEAWRSAASETGDARYLVVAETLEAIAAEFEVRGCLPQRQFEQIWSALRRELPRIRDASDARIAMPLADMLHREITSILSESWPQETQ